MEFHGVGLFGGWCFRFCERERDAQPQDDVASHGISVIPEPVEVIAVDGVEQVTHAEPYDDLLAIQVQGGGSFETQQQVIRRRRNEVAVIGYARLSRYILRGDAHTVVAEPRTSRRKETHFQFRAVGRHHHQPFRGVQVARPQQGRFSAELQAPQRTIPYLRVQAFQQRVGLPVAEGGERALDRQRRW